MNEKEKLDITKALAEKCKPCVLENCMKCPEESFQKLFGQQIKKFNGRKNHGKPIKKNA
jgi:hypothetical protein